MNKYIKPSSQIQHLQGVDLKIDNMKELEFFLQSYPYQTTINQVKYYYKVEKI